MNNPFMAALGGGQMPGPMWDLMQIKQKFQQFQRGFQGDPKEEVNKLLQSGAMSQQELNHLQSMAKQFGPLFH